MRPTTVWLAALVAACTRGGEAAPPPPDPAPPALLAHPAEVQKPEPCPLAAGYRGTVLGHRVFARLGRDGSRLYGRYFYEHAGIDLRLDGSISGENAMQLTEGEPDSRTGRFEGA